MEEKNFLTSLDEYFSSIDTEDVIKDRYGNTELDMSWLFTAAFDRSVIKEALSKIMQRVNKSYLTNLPDGKSPEDINKLVIGNYHGAPFIQVEGADAWTKLNITESGERLFNLPTISVDKFEKAIAAVLSIQKIKNEDQEIISAFVNNGCLVPDVANVTRGMNALADNLKSYFTYLYDLEHNSKEIVKTNIVFKQRSDTNGKSGKDDYNDKKKPYVRHHEIIPMADRVKCMDQDRIVGVVNAAGVDAEGKISDGYMGYVIEKPLAALDVEADGTLFVCEPVGGDKSTRVMYISKEEFDIKSDESPDEHMGQIVKKYLEMSLREFEELENTVSIRHTAYETFKERLGFFIDGKEAKSIITKDGLEKLRSLYGVSDMNLPYYKPRKRYNRKSIKDMVEGVETVDRTAQEAIIEKDTKPLEVKV